MLNYPQDKQYALLPQDTVTTLVVKNIPATLGDTSDRTRQFFQQYQALDVRLMQGKSMRGVAFLDFPNRAAAEHAYQQLHNLVITSGQKPLRVEYATPHPHRGSLLQAPLPRQSVEPHNVSTTTLVETEESKAQPIAPSLGLHYPSNPHLRYQYPDPTPEILSNIMHAIASVPRLYTQVLHLMNKMNLPPPFGPIDRESIPASLKRKHDDMLASDESELDSVSDEEKDDIAKREREIKQARLKRIAAEEQKKALRRTVATSSRSREVDAAPNEEPDAKRIKIVLANKSLPTDAENTTNDTTQEKIQTESSDVQKESTENATSTSKTTPHQTNEDIQTVPSDAQKKAIESTNTDAAKPARYLTMEEIQQKRMDKKDLENISAFKNYDPGSVNSKLYIKNLAKKVQEEDLRRLFESVIADSHGHAEAANDMDIQLKNSGRLRGQAFVTFANDTIAQTILESLNGYLLHDKPMAIHFSKQSEIKKNEALPQP
ncbi:uncharacterized protein BYT42DRAFT_589177 [Radiomyces spectabilis]|uniref:uncharacterized protein n=1 Tax=Radiomyces spectabilis TaxID=64574 RepID=UPI00221EB186|nr:uncharacterized protein BYT42DRAFT_589177 [Radiomyces spectabilis]KAI8365211.1 hypothetical protein BYT42DRAFT_589177 [Radiomyces spectabilis]